MRPQIGVMRAVIDVSPDGEVGDLRTIGNTDMLLHVDDDDRPVEPITEPIVLWSLGEDRLRGMLAAAAAGEPIDDIMFALHAAAAASPSPDDFPDP